MKRRVLGGIAITALAVGIGLSLMRGSGPPAAQRQTTIAGGPSTATHGARRSAEVDLARLTSDTVHVDDDPIGALVLEGQVVIGDASDPVDGATVVLDANPPRTAVTGADGAVGVTFLDNTMVSAGPSTVFEIERYRFNSTTHDGEFDASLKKGSLAVVSGKMVKQTPGSMRVRTPSSVMGVRGTEFLVRVD